MIALLYVLCTILVIFVIPVNLFWDDWMNEYKEYKKHKEDKHDQV